MSNNVKVDRDLEFKGVAQHKGNVKGPMLEVLRHYSDRFDGIALDTTNRWAVSNPGTSDTIAISEVQGGEVLMTTCTVDNDSQMLASAIIFSADKKAIAEFKILITDVSG